MIDGGVSAVLQKIAVPDTVFVVTPNDLAVIVDPPTLVSEGVKG